jgi:hypothetical protein
MRRELADDDRAGLAQPAGDNRIDLGNVVDQDLGMACGRQTGDIDDVLDPDRYAVQRAAAPPGRYFPAGPFGVRHRALRVQADKCVQLRIQRFDAR